MLDPFLSANDRDLVRWGATYLDGVAELLERAHTDEYGRIRPFETRVELKLLRAWLKRAEHLERLDALSRLLPPDLMIVDAPAPDPKTAAELEAHADAVLAVVTREIEHHSRKW